jgi:hypothetical protein
VPLPNPVKAFESSPGDGTPQPVNARVKSAAALNGRIMLVIGSSMVAASLQIHDQHHAHAKFIN